MSNQSDIELDLDALAPPKVKVQFNGNQINVDPPTVQQFAKIIDLGQKAKEGNQEPVSLYTEMEALVKELIPDVANSALNFAQISALFKLLSELGAPTDKAIEKLKEQGINLKESDSSPKDSTSPVL